MSTKCVDAIPHKVDDDPFDGLFVAADDAVLVPNGMLQLQSLLVQVIIRSKCTAWEWCPSR
jgi:hypothetical protein